MIKLKIGVLILLVMAIVAGCGKNSKQGPGTPAQPDQQAQRVEDRERKENYELLQRFIAKQKIFLIKQKKDALAKLKEIDADARKFSETMRGIEDDNIRLKKGAEYVVYEILNNDDLNQMALKYLDRDFQTSRASFTEAVRAQKKIFNRQQDTMIRSQVKFEADMQKINEATRNKNEVARRRLEQSNKALDREIASARKRAGQPQPRVGGTIVTSSSTGGKARLAVKRLNRVQTEKISAQSELRTLSAVKRLNLANIVHMEATEAESHARKKADLALDSRHAEIENMLAKTTHDKDMLNLAVTYRENAIARLQDQMLSKKDIFRARLQSVEENLRYIDSVVPMMDLMSAEELKALRGKLARQISKRVDQVISE